MKLYLLRHGATAGNLHRAFIGRTDEGLCEEGRAALRGISAPPCEVLICSPMRRCLETARILYPGMDPVLCEGLRECDFGEFEGHTHAELSGTPAYEAWLQSGGSLPCPGAEESLDAAAQRCVAAFDALMQAHAGARSVTLIVHGGTILSILHRRALPQRDYYAHTIGNGGGFAGEYASGTVTGLEAL
ncbi:MAG: histidine phosphatase family protein [Oscillospiraceae bacterium]|nr:histidine phosphatase family protein [Oscillospiraceae bacterium]